MVAVIRAMTDGAAIEDAAKVLPRCLAGAVVLKVVLKAALPADSVAVGKPVTGPKAIGVAVAASEDEEGDLLTRPR
jgi:hypothetical protein